jgi:hypothetical protein
MKKRGNASDSVQGAHEVCRLMEEVPRRRDVRGAAQALPDGTSVVRTRQRLSVGGYFLSLASTVIFVAVRASPSPLNSTFTFEPAAVASPAA